VHTSLPSPFGTSYRHRLARTLRLLAALTMLTSLAAGCGTVQATPRPSSVSPGSMDPRPTRVAAAPSPSSSPTITSYCGAQDATIPGAEAYLEGQGPMPTDLTTVQYAWFQMQASMVPACAEIVPDPPPVQTGNLTNGALSDAAFQTWLRADDETLTLLEWAARHNQPYLIHFLGWSPNIVAFVSAGGQIVDSSACEYVEKIYAVSLTSAQMLDITDTTVSTPGIAFAQATLGPCTSVWTASNGTVQQEGLTSGGEFRELDITSAVTSPAVGGYVMFVAHWPEDADEPTVTAVLDQSGI